MLSDRGREVLMAVVESYIGRPEPVGSRLLARRSHFNLSSATIRNIMADLEDMGYLAQPHTSAGRIPTDKGYRLYVDSIAGDADDDVRSVMCSLKHRLEDIKKDTDDLLKEAASMLSDATENMGFAVPLIADLSTLNRIHLYQYRGSRLVVVLITNEGAVKSRILDTDFGLSQRDLNRISDFLNSEYWGRSIIEIKENMMREISREKEMCDMLISRAMAICNAALTFPAEGLYVSGISRLLGLPEFAGRIDDIVRAIEDRHRILQVLERAASRDSSDVRVVIGSENPDSALRDLSIVMASYEGMGRTLGTLGMIGPTRMNYLRIIPLVDMTAKFVSSSLKR